MGSAKLLLGRPEETEGHVLEALRLSPRDTAALGWATVAGSAKMFLGAEEEAAAWYRRSIEFSAGYPIAHFCLGATLARMGQLEEARSEIQAGMTLDPKFTIRRYRAAAPSDNPGYMKMRERMIEGMRKAEVPEG